MSSAPFVMSGVSVVSSRRHLGNQGCPPRSVLLLSHNNTPQKRHHPRKAAVVILVPQDLHIHTTFSTGDGAVAPEQTVELVARFRHAARMGVSDHLDYVAGEAFEAYQHALRSYDLYVGVEVNGADWISEARAVDVDYYMYHCRDRTADYRGAEQLLETGKPVILAHPNIFQPDLSRVPPECCIEINNRYVWRDAWDPGLIKYGFAFVIGSDAHQPHWLNQNIARRVADEMGIQETLLFPENLPAISECVPATPDQRSDQANSHPPDGYSPRDQTPNRSALCR